MLAELERSLESLTDKEKARYGSYHKITPTSHTNIGGYFKPWLDMWLNFWDTSQDKIDWVNLDEFMSKADWSMPLWQIPLNKNNPYTPEKIRPVTSFEEMEKVFNPCRAEDIGNPNASTEEPLSVEEKFSVGNKLMMFHNGSGSMCLEAINFIKSIDYSVEEYLNTQAGFEEKLSNLIEEFGSSEGVHPLFGYYPMIFIRDRAFSGFNDSIKAEILKEITESEFEK
jgi:hypothetical protein